MPAETHSRRDEVTATDIVELLGAFIGLPVVEGPVLDTPLVDLGCDGDLVLLDLWDAAVEEYGERTLGDVDLDDLRSARTLADLAGLIASSCGGSGDGDVGNDQGDTT